MDYRGGAKNILEEKGQGDKATMCGRERFTAAGL